MFDMAVQAVREDAPTISFKLFSTLVLCTAMRTPEKALMKEPW